jgi:hypothetical protein
MTMMMMTNALDQDHTMILVMAMVDDDRFS